ncbi:MAG: GNAT family N-acetyltransferase [Lachnospirales bacterium]
MKMKKLELIDLENLYNKLLVEDFPKEELKSLKKLTRLSKTDEYISYSIYDGDFFVGYALFMTCKNMILLDYFAIVKDKRGMGYGSKALELIKTYFKDKYDILILESENPLCAKNSEDKIIRENRVKFYENNGFIKTDIKAIVYDVDYTIFIAKDTIQDMDKVAKLLYDVYIAFATEEKCRDNVFISL